MILEGNNKIYNITLCDSSENINKMINYFKKYNNFDDELIIGIDFEFNRSLDDTHREIALCQINLETKHKESEIFMFYPPELNDKQTNVLKQLLLNENIKTILHGGESLDIPYLFTEIFTNLNEKKQFCKNLFDTKYLCEYYNLKNNLVENKCKIYYLLLQMNVIDQKQMDYLLDNQEKMGNISEIRINVKDMSKELINYSAYDTLYLPELYKTFPKDDNYQKLIPEITSIHFILKQTDFFKKKFMEISQFNLLFLNLENRYILLNEIFQFMYLWNDTGLLSYLNQITYFKKFFQIIIKYIVYNILIRNYETFYKKNILNNNCPSSLNILLENISNFDYTINLLKQLNEDIKKELF